MLERWVFDVIVERLGSRLVHNLVSRMDFMEARLKTVRRTVYLVCTYVRRIGVALVVMCNFILRCEEK